MHKASSIALLVLALLAVATIASSQQIHLPPAISQSQTMSNVPVTAGDAVQQQQARAAYEQRQVEIRRDTDKMLQLTEDLKQSLTTSRQNVMSVDDLKRVEQIEKLAHSLKSKMKQSL